MGLIRIAREKCKGCYACIRSCPVKAIRVRDGLAEVVDERCIDCGVCLQVCVAGATQFSGDVDAVWELLEGDSPVIAVISAAFPAEFPEIHPKQMVTAIKELGFAEVIEDSFGGELVSQEYARLLQEKDNETILSSGCPVVISYIEKYYPQLIGNLAPIVSPMIATGRLIKWRYNPEAKVVCISPCVAKKTESRDEQVAGVIDASLSFTGLKKMFDAKGIVPESVAEGEFTGPKSSIGRLLAISGGLLKVAGLSDDILSGDAINPSRRDFMTNILREFATGNINARFINLCFRDGCIDGPVMDNTLSLERRREIITDYARSESDPEQTERDMKAYAGIDLSRGFTNRGIALPSPSEEEILAILKTIDKEALNCQLNCGACGYRTCRDLAIGICQGLAEPTMCWPFVVQALKDRQEELIQAEKLASLGQLAASVAHEVNNPLSGVLIYTRLLSKKIGNHTFSEQEALEYLSKMDSEVSRSSRIIRNLLDFSRQSEPTLRPVDVNQVSQQVLSLVNHQAELQNVEVIQDLSPSLPPVMADFDQLRQILLNLILNAIQSMPDGGQMTLRAWQVDDEIRIDVTDTGCGITEENLQKLFIPFHTTKERGQGVGLGLAVVKSIIERHKGRIEVHSEIGKGTTFTVYLEIHNEENG